MIQNQIQFEKSIPRYVNEHQVTIINNLITSGKIPVYLAQAGYKVLVVGSEKKLVPRLRFEAYKDSIDSDLTIAYNTALFDYHADYNILYMNYDKKVINHILSLRNGNIPVVLCVEDSFNCCCADLLIGLSKVLIQNGFGLKLVILNYISKYNEELQSFFEDTIIVNAPTHYNVFFNQLPHDDMCDMLLQQLQHGSNRRFLIFLSNQYRLNVFRSALQSGMIRRKISNVEITVIDSLKCSYKKIKELIYSDIYTRKIVISIDNNILRFPIEYNFDVILDDGLENSSIFYASSGWISHAQNEISQVSISQRQSLAGKSGPSIYYLCSDFENDKRKKMSFELHPSFIKMILSLRKSNISIKFLVPDNKYFYRYYIKLLKTFGAIKENGEISAMGEEILKLPFDIFFSKMFLVAKQYGVEFDILICLILHKFGNICTLSTPITDLKSDLFDQLLIFKELYFKKKLSITNAQINHATFKRDKLMLQKLCAMLSVKPLENTNIDAIKKCVTSGLPNCLFIQNSKYGYTNLIDSVTFYLPRSCSFASDFPCKYLIGFPNCQEKSGKLHHTINLATEISFDEVKTYFSHAFRTSYNLSPIGNVIQKNYYNEICISSKTMGTLEEVKKSKPDIVFET